MTQQSYYSTSADWGNSQYIFLHKFVNNFMSTIDNGDFIAGSERRNVIAYAKSGIQEFSYDSLKEIKAIELSVSDSLQITMPQDYVNYVRISIVDTSGMLYPLAVNTQLSVAKAYLQDSNYNLLFDGAGNVLTGTGTRQPSIVTGTTTYNDLQISEILENQANFNKNFSNVYRNGAFVINKEDGVIQFSSSISYKEIVLEYFSDGVTDIEDGSVKVHKFAEQALYDYVYWRLISRKTGVPFIEKDRAKKEFGISQQKMRRRINSLSVADLLQAFRGSNKWIK